MTGSVIERVQVVGLHSTLDGAPGCKFSAAPVTTTRWSAAGPSAVSDITTAVLMASASAARPGVSGCSTITADALLAATCEHAGMQGGRMQARQH